MSNGTDNDSAFVEFDGVQKSYDGETLVVKDLNLAIGKGEFVTMGLPAGLLEEEPAYTCQRIHMIKVICP